MFGSNNQDQPSQDNSQPNPATNNDDGFNDDQPATGQPGSLTEPTASPIDDASSAPHIDDSSDSNDQSNAPADLPDDRQNTNDEASGDDLAAIKQKALSELSPLVQHLDQSPEDKFKTLMMMIQANDNQDLIKDAYEAAQKITDDKAKSQALLDVINEINYFTQNKGSD